MAVLGAFIALCPRASAHEAAPGEPIGFDERLGNYAPLDASFSEEDGARVSLAELVKGRPTILVLGYYRCKNECGELFTGLSRALRGVGAVPGRDFVVLSISINGAETPVDARREKAMALAAVEGPFPEGAWRFLVGDDSSIDWLCGAVGFSYRKEGEDFDHPLGLIILAPDGKIVRYVYGTEFLPVDVSMSVLEASSGLVRPTVAKLLRLCFSYDPARKRIGFDLLRVSGLAVSALAFAFVLYLVLSGRRRSGKGSLR
jgi:protein SCO1/2